MNKVSLEEQIKIIAEIISKEKDFAKIGDITAKWLKKRGMSRSILLAVPDVDYKKIGKYPSVYTRINGDENINNFNLDVIAMFISSYATANGLNEAQVMEQLSNRIFDIVKLQTKFEEF